MDNQLRKAPIRCLYRQVKHGAGAGDRPDTMPSQWFLTKGRGEFVFTWLDHSCLYPGTIVMRKHGRHTHIDYNVHMYANTEHFI